MAFNIVGLIAIIFFYVLILLVGFWAARKGSGEDDSEEVMLAGRNIGVMVGIFTMTATWVGGGYINGTAEMLYSGGLIWCQAPFGYALSLMLGGILFAEKMREEGYVTMLDPFQLKYGQRMGGLLFIPALLGEVFWSAAILGALGATLSVILNIPDEISVIVSACIAVFYTFFGGLYSVAYTDVVQLFCIFIGLWICIPAALVSDKSEDLGESVDEWIGMAGMYASEESPEPTTTAIWFHWVDCGLLLVFGGIPWQVYFQRVLSSKTAVRAKLLSYVAAFGCIVMAVPPVLIGAIAKNTNWTATDWEPWNNGSKSPEEIPEDFQKLVLPLVLQYLTPLWVSFLGLGAVSAAVMSSADSSILSAASMFARNIWKLAVRPGCSEREIIMVMKGGIILVGVMATIMALTIKSIYGLWYLCADLVYVILFPQLLCVVYMERANVYGALSAYIVGLTMRISGGETLLGLPALIHYKWYDVDKNIQYFPFRTLSMLCSLLTLVSVSFLSEFLFTRRYLPSHLDVFRCIVNIPGDQRILRDPSFATSTDTLNSNLNARIRCENGGNVGPLLLNVPNGHSGPTTPATDVSSLSLADMKAEREPLNALHSDEKSYHTLEKR